MNDNSQARNYNLTLNNPFKYGFNDEKIRATLESLVSVDYYCMCHEKGSTEHVHIFLYARSPIRFRTIKRKFPTAHIERGRGTVQENRVYFQKTGKWEHTEKAKTVIKDSFFEFGEIPVEASEKAPKQFELLQLIKSGESTMDIIRNNPQYAFKGRDIDLLRDIYLNDKFSKIMRDVDVTYIFGKTAVGKTRFVYDSFDSKDICRITNYRNGKINFDSYHSQNVLVFDEFRSQIPISEMLTYLDVYPLQLPARYSDRTACYSKVYLLSNIPLDEQYPHLQIKEKETWNAFLRRFNAILEFKENGEKINHEKEEYRL